ncbi:uncharacterized protein LOC110818118 [Carica papaya]|uniref:uncharacterized protein LOC110818118 n=1 Tax=Carica papaya TaxID=3649 RepID=UPI000B8D1522|nr:uncharacterized protein LOC110818118 [Carica papaya]
MSRCFPYPPPGYARNGVSGQALIESIKLQRKKEKDITEQAKEKKRERKERKKERKEKEKLKPLELSANVKKIADDVIGNSFPKQREEEAEQVKSDLTVEHEQPISSQNLLYLSDSTQNSNKRKRHASPSTESHNNGLSSQLLFSRLGGLCLCFSFVYVLTFHFNDGRKSHSNRFSFKKHKGAEASSNEEGVCSTSGRTAYHPAQEIPQAQQQCRDINTRTNNRAPAQEIPRAQQQCRDTNTKTNIRAPAREIPRAQQQCRDTNTRTNIRAVGVASGPNKVSPTCSKIDSASPLVAAGNVSASSGNKARSIEMLYKSLVEDWLPPSLSLDENDTGELEWLLGTEQRKGSRVKRNETEEGVLCHVSSTLWPRAKYLPSADIHALPYTIPF